MAYKPGAPENKGFFPEPESTPGGLSLLKNTGDGGDQLLADLLIDDTVVAVLIDSTVLGAPIWFAFADDFKSGDDIPVFFVSELPFMRQMSEAELRRRYEEKRALGGGWIRDRIEPTEH